MFVERKLAKLRKEARRQLRRAEREIQRPPLSDKLHEREQVQQLAKLLADAIDEDNPHGLSKHLKNLRHRLDADLPFHRNSTVREYTEAILVALVLALFIRTFIIQAFKIPSGSMIPTLRVGDHILVNKFSYGISIPFTDTKIQFFGMPERGDIIVFKFPQDTSKDYIKRVIGLPGDTVEVRGDKVLINGEVVPKQEVNTYRYEDPHAFSHTGVLYEETLDGREHQVLYDQDTVRLGDTIKTVPEEHYFCMGDNRDHSNDSRYWGFVPFNYIKGKALIIYFSWPPGQFTRIGKLVR